MNLFFGEYNIKERDSQGLIIETNSGRSWFLLFFILILSFSKDAYIIVGGICLSAIIWSYTKHWEFDSVGKKVYRKSKILFGYEWQKEWLIPCISELHVSKSSSGESSYDYDLYLIMTDGEEVIVTSRMNCSKLKPIVKEIKRYIPQSLKYKFDEEWFMHDNQTI